MSRSRKEVASTSLQQTDSASLNQLAEQIIAADDGAHRSMAASLTYARTAGAKLLEAKNEFPYGQNQRFLDWAREKCGIPASTCYLYMKVAKEWNTLPDFQRVGKLSLRDAARLLQTDNEEDHANAIGELVSLELLRACDLDDLDPIERRTFVAEVKGLYEDLCDGDKSHPLPDALKEKRAALLGGWSPLITFDYQAVRTIAAEVLEHLKDGRINRHQVRDQLRAMETLALKNAELRRRVQQGTAESSGSSLSVGHAPIAVSGISLVDRVLRLRRCIAEVRAGSRGFASMEIKALKALHADLQAVLTPAQTKATAVCDPPLSRKAS